MFLDQIKYCEKKYCTIITRDVNWHYKVEQMIDYFCGFVEKVDSDCVVIMHPTTKCKTFIRLDQIVAIAEEQFLSESVPEEKKIIEEYRKEKAVIIPKSEFLDHKKLAEMAKKGKEMFKK